MRFFLIGPRLFGGLLRPGVSFRPDEILRKKPGAAARPSGEFVYVISNGQGAHKVGWTVDPKRRLADLQTGSPHQLSFAYLAVASARGYDVEQGAHAILSSHRGVGEWFAVDAAMAVAALNASAFNQNQNLLRLTPDQAAEAMRLAALAPQAKKPPSFAWVIAIAIAVATLAELRLFGGDNFWPVVLGNGVGAAILLPIFAKFT